MSNATTLVAALVACAAAGPNLSAEGGRVLPLTTRSEEARAGLRELQLRVETLRGGAAAAELARGIVASDPDFALGHYYLSATTPASENQKHLQKAGELAKNASPGERRLIEAMVVARGERPQDATDALRKLAEDYPDERILWVLLGQNLAAQARLDEARAAYEKAIALDASTPRAHVLLGHVLVLKGDYAAARERYTQAAPLIPKGQPITPATTPIAFTWLYEGNADKALEVMRTAIDQYATSERFGDLPEVFLWNAMARINLEHGRLEEAMAAYEKGFASVPGSKLSDEQKQLWLGRLHHGRGRTLARMGRHAEAWKEAERIKAMIDEGGERGTRFLPAWHYIAGYLKLEAKEHAAAVEHLKQADLDDPFHKLLLARAQERSGNTAEAKKLYAEIVASRQNNLERALAFPEARRKLDTL